MASNKRKTQPKKAEWRGYHRVNLDKADEALFEQWRGENVPTFADLDILANNGYKFAVSWDPYHEGVSASLYCTDAKMEWAGYTLSAWAGDTETATQLLFFKHYVLCREHWEIAPEKADKGTSPYG